LFVLAEFGQKANAWSDGVVCMRCDKRTGVNHISDLHMNATLYFSNAASIIGCVGHPLDPWTQNLQLQIVD
jgi:hypothetical protein